MSKSATEYTPILRTPTEEEYEVHRRLIEKSVRALAEIPGDMVKPPTLTTSSKVAGDMEGISDWIEHTREILEAEAEKREAEKEIVEEVHKYKHRSPRESMPYYDFIFECPRCHGKHRGNSDSIAVIRVPVPSVDGELLYFDCPSCSLKLEMNVLDLSTEHPTFTSARPLENKDIKFYGKKLKEDELEERVCDKYGEGLEFGDG